MNAADWQGPPSDLLGGPAHVQRFVARNEHLVAALQHVVAYPQGCALSLHVVVRRGALDDASWEALFGGFTAGTPDLGLAFGVRFPDGSSATTVGNALRGWTRPTDRPDPPMLVENEGSATLTDDRYQSEQRLWLWPLPPPAPFEFVIAWPELGMEATATTLDGRAVVRAAEQAERYWP